MFVVVIAFEGLMVVLHKEEEEEEEEEEEVNINTTQV
jgi:hypothetical protein